MTDFPPGTFLRVARVAPRRDTPSQGRQSGVEIGHWAAGFLVGKIEIGQPVVLVRVIRDGVTALGQFNTSLITKIEGCWLISENSVYEVRRARLEIVLGD